MNIENLSTHPRLYISTSEIQRLQKPASIPFLQRAEKEVEQIAELACNPETFTYPENTHNFHLLRARVAQKRIISLLVQWLKTNHSKYKNAVIDHIKAIKDWEYWSWIKWKSSNPAPDAIWDLSYGENSATIAIAWDILFNHLSDAEKEIFKETVKKWVIPSFLKYTTAEKPTWWYTAHNSNWLAVCAGGAGLIALAFYEEFEECKIILERSNNGISNFISTLERSNGGWGEGVLYWNYGMRYAFLYLLSYENATKSKHPSLDKPGTLKTLYFPTDFSPNQKTCGFGDLNEAVWQPIAQHFGVAHRLNASDLIYTLNQSQENLPFEETWATAAEILALHPRTPTSQLQQESKATVKIYQGIDWAFFADNTISPSFYVSMRGGTTDEPHNMEDLLSWNCMVKTERMISSVSNREYIDTTFSNQRFRMPEIRADHKNTILIGGVGISHPCEVKTLSIQIEGHKGFLMNATKAYEKVPNIIYVGRIFLFLEEKHLLVLDKIQLEHTNRIETRAHTYAEVQAFDKHILLTSGKENATIYYACNVPAMLAISQTTPTKIQEPPAKVLRWAPTDLYNNVFFATLLTAGGHASTTQISINETHCNIQIKDKKFELGLDNL